MADSTQDKTDSSGFSNSSMNKPVSGVLKAGSQYQLDSKESRILELQNLAQECFNKALKYSQVVDDYKQIGNKLIKIIMELREDITD